MIELTGLSWGHRRATTPLQALASAFTQTRPDIAIRWIERPLSDFEHQGIAGAACAADLVVFDHPFCGDIVASDAFLPLDDLNKVSHSDAFIGPSLESYRFAGHLWGAPIDGATMHGVARSDLLNGAPIPKTWTQTLALGDDWHRRGRYLGLPFATPHGALAVASLMANMGHEWAPNGSTGELLLDPEALDEALGMLETLAHYCPPEAQNWNSIDLHEAMVARDDIVFCPCVYGYATYGEADQRKPLAFSPFAGFDRTAPDCGSVIGGTAIGLSAGCQNVDAAIAFLGYCLEPDHQLALVPSNHGQPATRRAWLDREVDQRFNGFFSSVGPSMARASIRPRCAGYPAFQKAAGVLVQQMLAGALSRRKTVSKMIGLSLTPSSRR